MFIGPLIFYKQVQNVDQTQVKLHLVQTTVKRLIIGVYLFGEIGEFKKFTEISRHQIKISQFLDIPVLEIAKLIICQTVIPVFEKGPNIIAAKNSRFTVC